jgi:hypothetical protein
LKEILRISHFLEIQPLVQRCLSLLEDNIDDLPPLDGVPIDLLWKLLERLPPKKLLRLELQQQLPEIGFARHEFFFSFLFFFFCSVLSPYFTDVLPKKKKNQTTDTYPLWRREFERRSWNLQDGKVICSWDEMQEFAAVVESDNSIYDRIVSLYESVGNKKLFWSAMDRFQGTIRRNAPSSPSSKEMAQHLRTLYIERDLQEACIAFVPNYSSGNVLDYLKEVAQFISQHSAVPEMLTSFGFENYIAKLEQLRMLEIHHLETEMYMEPLVGFLKSHPQCSCLRLTFCNISNGDQLKELMAVPSLVSLDLSNNVMDEKGILSFLPLLENSSIKQLSLHGNSIKGLGFEALMVHADKLELLDVSQANITFCNWLLLSKMSSIKTLILNNNPITQGRSHMPEILVPLFQSLPNTVTALDMSFCQLSDKQIKSLCGCLTTRSNQLLALNLGSNYLGSPSATHLSNLLKNPTVSLTRYEKKKKSKRRVCLSLTDAHTLFFLVCLL